MKRYAAELVGTFVLVFGGCGSAVLAGEKIGFAGVSFAFSRCWPWCMPSGPSRAVTSTPP
jgi:glycerol uptake facilitator-like aquaporin